MSDTQSVDQSVESGGIGFAGMLTLLFIGLKLTGYVTWSWWWVLSPLWISFAIVCVIILIVILALVIIDR